MTAAAAVLARPHRSCRPRIDWVAVHHGHQAMRYVFKPLTLVLLTAAALALDPDDPTVRTWFVVALVMSLAGDIFLMLPGDLFVPGLGVVPAGPRRLRRRAARSRASNRSASSSGSPWWPSPSPSSGRGSSPGVRRTEPALGPPVLAYMGVISAMLVCAIGTAAPLAIAGAGLFYASDALIGWGRFVEARPWGDLAVMVTYHLGQVLLVLFLV